ncbi:MAG: hypothetical protein KDE31_28550, partial [Caldilineaceae bacterium]|nr:hypothetical protein [Caldilineaceae bacterium]
TLARNAVRIELTEEGCNVHAPHATPVLTLLLPPDRTVVGHEVTSTQIVRWGREYTVVTLHDLAANERRSLTW